MTSDLKSNNEKLEVLKVKTINISPFREFIVSYILEIPRLLLSSFLACLVVVAIINAYLSDEGNGFGSIFETSVKIAPLGYIFAGPALLFIYLPCALILKKESKINWLLPVFGTIIATFNSFILTITIIPPIVGIVITPCFIMAGLFTGIFHGLLIKFSNKFYFKKCCNHVSTKGS